MYMAHLRPNASVANCRKTCPRNCPADWIPPHAETYLLGDFLAEWPNSVR